MMRRVLVLMLILSTRTYGQAGFASLRADGNGIPALIRLTTIRVHDEPLGDALRRLTRAASVDLSAPGALPALGQRVTLDTGNLPLSAALLILVRGTGVELLVSESGPTMVVRASGVRTPTPSSAALSPAPPDWQSSGQSSYRRE